MPLTRNYAICTNPRSGSWLLSELLESTHAAGIPREWFHDDTERSEAAKRQLTDPHQAGYRDYLAAITRKQVTPNGVFGMKLHWYQFAGLREKLATIDEYRDLSPGQRVLAAFPDCRFIWLTRRDKVRQAISYHKASQTDTWWNIDRAEPVRRANARTEPVFDVQAIDRLERLLLANEQSWLRFFRELGIQPLVVIYEELAARQVETARAVLEFLEIPGAIAMSIAGPRVQRQANQSTEEWVARYLAAKRGQAAKQPPAGLARAEERQPANQSSLTAAATAVFAGDRSVNRPTIAPNAPLAHPPQIAADHPSITPVERELQQLRKLHSLSQIRRELERLSPELSNVRRVAGLSRDEFLERYYAANRPVILTDLTNDWPARELWSPEYLDWQLGGERVEVMAGRNSDPNYEINGAKHRQEMLFSQYVERILTGGETNDYYLVANNQFFKRPAVKRLLDDIHMPPAYLDPQRVEGHVHFWFGPAGTVTPLHHDTMNIFMSQVYGRKRVRLIPAAQWEWIYNHTGVYSPVDPEQVDDRSWPDFVKADMIDIVLEPGETLFLPVGWWHHVRALDVSISVSFTNFVFPNHYGWRHPSLSAGVLRASPTSSANVVQPRDMHLATSYR